MSQGLFMRLKIQPTLNVGYIAVSAAVSLACAESTRDVHLQHWSDTIRISIHCQWYNKLKIHMKQHR